MTPMRGENAAVIVDVVTETGIVNEEGNEVKGVSVSVVVNGKVSADEEKKNAEEVAADLDLRSADIREREVEAVILSQEVMKEKKEERRSTERKNLKTKGTPQEQRLQRRFWRQSCERKL